MEGPFFAMVFFSKSYLKECKIYRKHTYSGKR